VTTRRDWYAPDARVPVSGTARRLWDKVVRETGAPPLWLQVVRPGRWQVDKGACSHVLECVVDGVKREYLAWWPNEEALAVPLRECHRDRATARTYWIGHRSGSAGA
jgi:hypothetical protein